MMHGVHAVDVVVIITEAEKTDLEIKNEIKKKKCHGLNYGNTVDCHVYIWLKRFLFLDFLFCFIFNPIITKLDTIYVLLLLKTIK